MSAVSQRARDAAAEIVIVLAQPGWLDRHKAIRAGELDSDYFVQAFARFETETLEAAAKRIEGLLTNVPPGVDLYRGGYKDGIDEALAALRNPSEQETYRG